MLTRVCTACLLKNGFLCFSGPDSRQLCPRGAAEAGRNPLGPVQTVGLHSWVCARESGAGLFSDTCRNVCGVDGGEQMAPAPLFEHRALIEDCKLLLGATV